MNAKHEPRMSNVAFVGENVRAPYAYSNKFEHDACDDKVVIVSNFTSVLSLVERIDFATMFI